MQRSSRLGAAQSVSTSTTSAASSAFGAETFQILVVATVDTRIRIGDGTPTAVAADTLLPASTMAYFTVTPGQKIAAILGTGTGELSVTEVS
jgi:hypothetical protein